MRIQGFTAPVADPYNKRRSALYPYEIPYRPCNYGVQFYPDSNFVEIITIKNKPKIYL